MQRRAFRGSLSLLESFSPAQWGEDSYVRMPPFVTEDIDGTVLVIPTSSEAERTLDAVSAPLGLKKTKNGQTCYLAGKAESIRALRMFNWFVRRSWRKRELAVLWAIAHLQGHQPRANSPVSIESLTAMTGCGPKFIGEVIRDLPNGGTRQPQVGLFGHYGVDNEALHLTLEKRLEETPTQTEELVMEALCSGMGSSAADIYNRTFPRELTLGAVYKVSEGLKQGGYIHTTRHFRVNEKGPMRELLSSDCQNCFYGYSSADRCFDDAFRELEHILRRYYQKELSEEERTSSYSAIKSAPFGPKVIRKVLEALKLIHHMDILMNERNVVNVLRKLEDWYGVEFPVHRGLGEGVPNIPAGKQ